MLFQPRTLISRMIQDNVADAQDLEELKIIKIPKKNLESLINSHLPFITKLLNQLSKIIHCVRSMLVVNHGIEAVLVL